MERLEAVGVPCAPILTVPEVLAEPQTRALGMVQTIPESGVDVIGLPLRLDGVRPGVRRPAPRVGEHTAAVLGDSQDRGAPQLTRPSFRSPATTPSAKTRAPAGV